LLKWNFTENCAGEARRVADMAKTSIFLKFKSGLRTLSLLEKLVGRRSGEAPAKTGQAGLEYPDSYSEERLRLATPIKSRCGGLESKRQTEQEKESNATNNRGFSYLARP
jgi:hypothetical protein